MRSASAALLSLLACVACDRFTPIDDGGDGLVSTDLHCPALPDMAPGVPKCAAAKGLLGDSLICADFSGANAVQSIDALRAMGWVLSKDSVNSQDQWEIAGGVLQVKNFAAFTSTATVTVPGATMAQLQTYSRLTLSLQQRIDLVEPDQNAEIYLSNATPNTRRMWSETGKKDVFRQQTTITVDGSDLTPALKAGYQWLLQITSSSISSRNGWQFESIAVLGTQ